MRDMQQMPDWMRERLASKERTDAVAELEHRKIQAAQKLIARMHEPFWDHLSERLRAAVAALPSLKLMGRFIPGVGKNVQVRVMKSNGTLRETHTDLSLSADRIRCTTLDLGFFNLLFVAISDEEIAVVNEQTPAPPMNPDETAQFIMEKMMDYVESPKAIY